MQAAVELVLIFLVVIGFASVLGATRIAAIRQTVRAKRAQRLAAAQELEIQRYRSANPVRIVGRPNVEAFNRVFDLLDEFTRAANAFRPKPSDSFDRRYLSCEFPRVHFDPYRPHPDAVNNSGDPGKISLTADDIKMSSGRDLSKLYKSAAMRYDFPCPRPHWQFDTSAAPVLPSIKIPKNIEANLRAQNGDALTAQPDIISKYYRPERDEVSSINLQTASLLDRLNQKNEAAKEAYELMEIYLGQAKLKVRDAEANLARDFAQVKSRYENDREEAVGPILGTFAKYFARDADGIKTHFVLALCHLSLPLPADYPWSVFYKPDERLLQVNQCVPSASDISVVRSDSKRALAKRDVDAILRRYVPAVALQMRITSRATT
jgi:type II secretory pathway pseudopilin PulG